MTVENAYRQLSSLSKDVLRNAELAAGSLFQKCNGIEADHALKAAPSFGVAPTMAQFKAVA